MILIPGAVFTKSSEDGIYHGFTWRTVMPIVDSQVHAYERNHRGRPWVGTLHGPAEVTGDQMVRAMDAVGAGGAILVSPFSGTGSA
jgi:hypothetical protein